MPLVVSVRGLGDVVRRHPVGAVFLVALGCRIVLVLLLHQLVGTEFFGIGDDATYSFLAEGMAEGRSPGWDPYARQLYNTTATFTVPLTLIHLAFGSVRIGGPLLAALAGALTAAFVTKVATGITSVRWAVLAGIGVALFPSQVLWSSFTLKDSTVWAVLTALALVVALAARATGRRLLYLGLGASFLLLLVGHLRTHTFVVATWGLALASFFSLRSSRVQRVAGSLLIAVALPWVLGLGPAALTFVLHQDVEYRRTANAFGAATAFVPDAPPEDPVELQQRVEELERQLALVRAATRSASPEPSSPAPGGPSPTDSLAGGEEIEELTRQLKDAREQLQAAPPPSEEDTVLSPTLRHLPKGLSVMLFEPYPWQTIDNQRVRLAQLENVFWYPLLALAALGLVQVLRDTRTRTALAFPVFAGGGILLVYALTEGNFGTAYRHRGEFVWVVFLLAAAGLTSLWGRRRSDEAPREPQ